MKRVKIIILATLMLCLSACNENADEQADVTSATVQTSETTVAQSETTTAESKTEVAQSETTEPTQAAVKKHVIADDYGLTESNFPRMDGSTSAIPLEGGLRAMLFDVPQLDGEASVNHTKTHTAFQRLLDGEVDVILSVPLSKEQEQLAKDKNVEIELIPIAYEGFVFIVNKDNPVNSLTQEQIRDIYSGKITNWKEVGGNDAEIIPYQRNLDSGSQNHMTVFMGDTPMLKPQIELIRLGMEGLLDSIAVYDNSINAIGYSIYSYAAQMYGESVNVKFIAVDGVPVSLETLEDQSYPLLSVTYIMYRKDTPDDSATAKLIEFTLSDEGRTAIRNSGYIPAF